MLVADVLVADVSVADLSKLPTTLSLLLVGRSNNRAAMIAVKIVARCLKI